MPTRICIIGTGIAALSCAHELTKSGLSDIEIYTRDEFPGGLAFGRLDETTGYPYEHSMRAYLDHYGEVFRLLDEIGSLSNLQKVDIYVQRGSTLFPLDVGNTGLIRRGLNLIKVLRSLEIGYCEIIRLMYRIVKYAFFTNDQKKQELRKVSFMEYFHWETWSSQARKAIASLMGIIVAARPTSNAESCMSLLEHMALPNRHPYTSGKWKPSKIMAMNQPTNMGFIDPLVSHLRKRGVKFNYDTRVVGVVYDGNKVSGIVTEQEEIITGHDIYVFTGSFPDVHDLLEEKLENTTTDGTDFSFGCQVYLKKTPAQWEGKPMSYIMVLGSAWEIVYCLQNKDSWIRGAPPGTCLSITFSNVYSPGILFGKPFFQCTPEEVYLELLAQIGLSLQEGNTISYRIDDKLAYLPYEEAQEKIREQRWTRLDPTEVVTPYLWIAESSLWVVSPHTKEYPPKVETLQNTFVAGTFLNVPTSLPTMQKAAESGVKCAQAILKSH
jgi:uncharacterized protein with NAD-binding domain and iron-sulfur cluster